MTTDEAARKAGVTARQLREWQRDGWLTPASNGRMDNGRRIEWSDADVAKAVASSELGLWNFSEMQSSLEQVFLEMTGGGH